MVQIDRIPVQLEHPWQGSTTVIVDRQLEYLELVTEGFFLHGSRCLVRSSINEAIDVLRQPDGPSVDLLITDLPKPSDPQFGLVEHLKALFPRLQIISMSPSAESNLAAIQRAEITVSNQSTAAAPLRSATPDEVA